MTTKSDDNLAKALALLKQSARSAKSASTPSALSAGRVDLEDLFLAELKLRRVRLTEWIDMLSQAADTEAAPRVRRTTQRKGSQSCRSRRRDTRQVG